MNAKTSIFVYLTFVYLKGYKNSTHGEYFCVKSGNFTCNKKERAPLKIN